MRLAALAVQTSALLAMAALLPCQFGALTLVIAASQAALVLPLRTTLGWMALQTAGVALFLVPSCHLQEGFAEVTALAGFQGFAAVAIYLARREADARANLSHANAELVATRSLLEEASRAHERTRIARELHDVLGHDLTALGLQLEIATHVDADAGRTHLTRAQEVNARLLHNVRDVVGAMKSAPAPDLSTALRALVADVPGLAVHLEAPETLLARGGRDPRAVRPAVRPGDRDQRAPARARDEPLDPRPARGRARRRRRPRRRTGRRDLVRRAGAQRHAGTPRERRWAVCSRL